MPGKDSQCRDSRWKDLPSNDLRRPRQGHDGGVPEFDVPDAVEPWPLECLPCYVRRMLTFGCRGMRGILAYRAARPPGGLLLVAALAELGVSCDCQLIDAAYEPHMFQTRNDDGEYIRPRPLVEVRACLGIGTGPPVGRRSDSWQHCGLWERKASHPGPPWA